MTSPPQPEFVRPEASTSERRSDGARGLFADENLDLLAHLLDDWFHIPGTSIRFGLDGLIGLVPGLGDILAGLASSILIVAAWGRGLSYVTLARMVVNVGLDVVIGSVPLLGDAFDVAWKANRRNYTLMVERLGHSRRQAWRDWVFLSLIAVALLAIFLTPLLMIVWALEWFHRHS